MFGTNKRWFEVPIIHYVGPSVKQVCSEMGRKVAGFAFLLLSMCLVKGTVSSAATQVAAGSCGENATWTLDNENVLTIRGTGRISDRSWEQSQ